MLEVDAKPAGSVQAELAAGDTMQPRARMQIAAEAKQMDAGEVGSAGALRLRQSAQHVLRSVICDESRERRGTRTECTDGRPGATTHGELEERRDPRRARQACD